MKPPANVYAQVSRDRGQTFRMKADLRHPHPEPLPAGRRALEDAAASVTRRRREAEAREKAGRRAAEAASRAWMARVDRTLRPAVEAGRAADKRLREALDKGRDDAARAAGDDRPAPLLKRLSPSEIDVAARELMLRRPELSYPEARKAIMENAPVEPGPGVRPDGGPASTRRVTVLPLPQREPLPPAVTWAPAPSNIGRPR